MSSPSNGGKSLTDRDLGCTLQHPPQVPTQVGAGLGTLWEGFLYEAMLELLEE